MDLGSDFEEAKLGIMRRAGQDSVTVYDYDRCVAVLMRKEGWTDEEAEEWMEYNVLGSWMGDETPAFVVTNEPALAPSTLLSEPHSYIANDGVVAEETPRGVPF